MDYNVERMETGVRIAGKTAAGVPKTINVDDDGHLILDINQETPDANGVVIKAPIPAGDNNIGNVDLASPIPTGTNTIGKVSIDQETEHANEVVVKAVESTIIHTDVTVGLASGIALIANPNRTYALLINDSDAPIYIRVGVAAALSRGILLNPKGGSYEMAAPYSNLDTRSIYAISAFANKTLLVTEGI
jgi:hypothetical protein